MCLVLAVQAPETARPCLEAAARSLPPAALQMDVKPVPRGPRGMEMSVQGTIYERDGCACSLLTDDADWDAPFWSMRPEVLEPLARTLEAVGAAVPEGLMVAALWDGDVPGQEQVLSLHELAAIARAGRLGTRTRYRIE